MPNYIIKLLKGAGAHNTKLICETEASSSLASGSARKSEWKVLRIKSRMRCVLEKGARIIHQHRQLVIKIEYRYTFQCGLERPIKFDYLQFDFSASLNFNNEKESSSRRSDWNTESAIETVK